MHLRFEMIRADTHREHRHPQVVMRELGITYTHSTPQTLGEQWWFWNCDHIPAELPPYLSVLRVSWRDAIGYGLTPKEAAEIERGTDAE